ncbi:MAG TPA: 2-amino-4-hydroxy-6-hydroxymethyldihydropteridine diphosphokinase [Pseudolysinimonas sp.]|nr:2-amino-4-hydroxy-6-hydroxymethyldihydropteridine diphosphokinase [Pseudolysinimonas sp.]
MTAPAREVEAVVAFGSNLGDRAATLLAAARELADTAGIELVAMSSVHETAAVRPEGIDVDAPAYLNAVALVRTTLAPVELLRVLNAIEHAHGRVRAERWGDRTLDLDLIDVSGTVLVTDDLVLPHPRAHERDFVLAPWLEIAPDATLPGYGRIDALLAGLHTATGGTP